MRTKRAGGEEIVEHFASLPKGAGSAEERVNATARYFKVSAETVHKHLKFWWPGKLYIKEFGEAKGHVKWDRPTSELLKALNHEGSVAKAAKALNTTAVTLARAIERHHIEQRWVVVDREGDRDTRDAKLIQSTQRANGGSGAESA